MPLTRIEPLRSCPAGRYEDELVVVQRVAGARLRARRLADGRVAVQHGLAAGDVDDEIAGPLAAVLAGHTGDHEVFKRAFTGAVLTSAPDAGQAWELFYRNSLARIRRAGPADYSAVYRHAAGLLAGASVADLGCGFGFLALYLAGRGALVTACDSEPGMAALLARTAGRLNLPLRALAADGRCVPAPAGSFDAVTLLHVLEHVDELTAAALLAEAQRLARHRVIIAVPYETEPSALFGHVRLTGPQYLRELGAGSGWPFRVYEHHGGWLVLEHPARGRPQLNEESP